MGLLKGAGTKNVWKHCSELILSGFLYRHIGSCAFIKCELCSVSARRTLQRVFVSFRSSPVLYISVSVYAVLRFIYVYECLEKCVYFCMIFSWCRSSSLVWTAVKRPLITGWNWWKCRWYECWNWKTEICKSPIMWRMQKHCNYWVVRSSDITVQLQFEVQDFQLLCLSSDNDTVTHSTATNTMHTCPSPPIDNIWAMTLLVGSFDP